ncbi:MAG: hypothetical protein DDT42_01446 [candidate division WS2 bacterium]|uniref:Major facilitator superfamily (MFS) profile domain-containing protein n=1 Tax=Psychracetigena formicireducens TaxID=2986056 RepID=A0A9E2F7H0_PSYF1|nr:hypothetical protein [Candidatus Psychracetigena formicireducens]MBT9145573.1 hypothetical protein [Candidatus Psychracetigena formicireducens]
MKNFYFLSITIGAVFLATTILWVVYNSYVPIMLKSFGISSFLVGLLMTVDNILAVTWGPLVGILSDNTKTRWGKRIPYFLVSIPFIALLFSLIPLAFLQGLIIFSLLLILLNIFIATARTPMVALIPDLFVSGLRSQSAGIINFMGGIGAVVGFLLFPSLYALQKEIPFLVASLIIIITGAWLVISIKENKSDQIKEIRENLFSEMIGILKNKELLKVYLVIFTYFLGFNAIETFFTSYGKFQLGIEEHQASFLLGMLAVSFFLFSLPAGVIGGVIGKKKTMSIGLLLISVVMAALFMIDALVIAPKLILIASLLIVAGLCWALINVNAIPLVTDLSPPEKAGTGAGFYYFFSMSAAIVSPPLTGLIIDFMGYPVIFLIASVFMLGGWFLLMRLRK